MQHYFFSVEASGVEGFSLGWKVVLGKIVGKVADIGPFPWGIRGMLELFAGSRSMS